MKQLTCEMCGSTDFLKQEGVFVCQSCGIKYSVEEAKKLISKGVVQTQGTVQADKTSETETLLKKAYMPLEDGDRKSANEYCVNELERAFMFLEDGNWENADKYLEKVLDADPKNPQAYLGKLMLELRVRKKEELGSCSKCFDQNKNYQKILLFGSDTLKNEVESYLQSTKNHLAYRAKSQKKARQQFQIVISILIIATFSCVLIGYSIIQWDLRSRYNSAQDYYEKGDYENAYWIFSALEDYSDSEFKAQRARTELEKSAWVVIDNVTVKIPYDWKRAGYVTVSGDTIIFPEAGHVPTIDVFLSWLDAPSGKIFYATGLRGDLTGLKSFLVKDFAIKNTKDSSSDSWRKETVDLLFYGENTLKAAYRRKNGTFPKYVTGTGTVASLPGEPRNDWMYDVNFNDYATTIVGQYYDRRTHANPETFQITVIIE